MSWIERIYNKSHIIRTRKSNIPEGVWTKSLLFIAMLLIGTIIAKFKGLSQMSPPYENIGSSAVTCLPG